MEGAFVRVIQIVEELSDGDDKDDLPAGGPYYGASRDYPINSFASGLVEWRLRMGTFPTEDEVLDVFHQRIPIGCLDDFHIAYCPSETEIRARIKAMENPVQQVDQSEMNHYQRFKANLPGFRYKVASALTTLADWIRPTSRGDKD